MALNFSVIRYNHNSQIRFEHEEMRYAYFLGISKLSQLLCQAVFRQSSGSRQAATKFLKSNISHLFRSFGDFFCVFFCMV